MRSKLTAALRRRRVVVNGSNSLLMHAILGLLAAALTLTANPASAQFGERTISSLDQTSTPKVLPQDIAFPVHIGSLQNGKLAITWTPAPEHYLYRHRFAFSANGIDRAFTLPEGLAMEDEFFGAIEAYFGAVTAQIDLSPVLDLPTTGFLSIRYQGCASWGFCYPPQTRDIPLQDLID